MARIYFRVPTFFFSRWWLKKRHRCFDEWVASRESGGRGEKKKTTRHTTSRRVFCFFRLFFASCSYSLFPRSSAFPLFFFVTFLGQSTFFCLEQFHFYTTQKKKNRFLGKRLFMFFVVCARRFFFSSRKKKRNATRKKTDHGAPHRFFFIISRSPPPFLSLKNSGGALGTPR